MSTVTLIMLDSCDGYHAGDEREAKQREADQLIRKGLAKMKGPHANKMADDPQTKKNTGTSTAGKDAPSSSSAPDRASRPKTAPRSPRGGRSTRNAE